MGLVWIWLLATNKVCSSQHNVLSVSKSIFRRIDHKHENMLSDHRDAGLEQIWPRMADENLPTNLLIFCYLVKKSPWIDFLMCYQLVENKGFIIKTTNWQQVMQIFGNVSMAKKINKLGNCSAPKSKKQRKDVVNQFKKRPPIVKCCMGEQKHLRHVILIVRKSMTWAFEWYFSF